MHHRFHPAWYSQRSWRPSFDAPLQASLAPYRAAGDATPTFTRASTAYVPGYGANAAVTDAPTALLLDSGEAGFWGARRISANAWSLYDANGVLLVPANGANTGLCDQYGNFGYFAGGARADVLGTTDAIRRKMTDAGWVSGGGGIAVTDAVGFDGGATTGACLAATGANGTILFTTVLGAAIRTYSAWVRRKTGTGTVEMTKDGGTTWTAITLTAAYPILPFSVTTASAANPVVGFRIVTSGDAIEVDFNTLEAATFANPTPIPVNVSKAADVLTYPSAGNISIPFTLYAEVNLPYFDAATNRGIWGTTGVTTDLIIKSGVNNSNFRTTAPADNVFTATLSVGITTKIAISQDAANTKAIYEDGAILTGGGPNGGAADLTGPMRIGSSTVGELFGTIRNLRIYPKALSASRMQALTT